MDGWVVLALAVSQQVYEAPFREPTPEETQILEFMNRFRADPSAEADLIAPPGRNDRGVDWKMFRDEMKQLKKMPPLVFNLDLLESARKHSYYMIHNGLGHVEEPGKTGFVAASFGDRCKAAGYKGGPSGENAFKDSGGAWDSHWGFVVDYGAGPGGMQPERGHRRNMISNVREVGPGGVPHEKRLSVTHNFGSRDVRLAGGVVYIDHNNNKFYDPGEGLGNVQISGSGGESASTWRSGAFAMDLKGQAAVTLTAAIDGEKFTKTFPAGAENLKFDWVVPAEIALKKADRYLEAVEKAPEAKRAAALVNLYHQTRGLYVDADRRAKIDALTKEVGPDLEARQKAVLEALKDVEAPGLAKLIDDQRKPYKGTDADAWFEDAETLAKLKRGVAGFLKQPKPSDRERKQMAQALEDQKKRMKIPAFKADVDGLVAKVSKTERER
jgi:hypothetical protein